MVEVELLSKKPGFVPNFIIVKLEKNKKNFEILADPDSAWKAKQYIAIENDKREKEAKTPEEKANCQMTVKDVLANPEITISDIFQNTEIFENIKKFNRIPENEIEEVFGTDDMNVILATFLLEGDFSCTKKQRDEIQETKKKKIIQIITMNASTQRIRNRTLKLGLKKPWMKPKLLLT